MITVTIHLKSAITGRVTEIGYLEICNTGDHPDHPRRGNYTAKVFRRGTRKGLRSGFVKNYPKQAYNVWRLVLRALKSAFPEER